MNVEYTEVDEDQLYTMPCVYCKTGIDIVAIKCPACGSFQNWRRHLGLVATIISLFLGTVATYGLMKEPINYLFKKEYSVRTQQVSVTSKTYTVELKNTGRKPFSINSASAYIQTQNEHSNRYFYILEWDTEVETLAPGEVSFLKLTIPETQRQKYLNDKENILEAVCGVTIKTSADDNIFTGGQHFNETVTAKDGTTFCRKKFEFFLSGVDIANVFNQDILEKMNNGVGKKLKEALEKIGTE